jgi:tetratricopeptide (TPR) repeat protein
MDESTLARLNEAMQLQIGGKLAEAEAIYRDVLENDPENPDANHLLGLIRSEEDNNDEAVALIEKAIGLHPNAAPFHHNIAGIYRRMGRLQEAEAEFRRAIELKPDYGEAYQGLAEMVRFERTDPFYGQVMGQLRSPHLDNNVRCYFHFAAGKFLDDIGEYPAAFEQYRLGNKAANKPFDSAEFRQQVKDTIYVFSQDFVAKQEGKGNASEQPVFIVGMPRSGTTLVEQILSSHSQVYGAGELNDMKYIARSAAQLSRIRQPWPNCASGLAGGAFARLGDEYLSRIAALTPGPFDRVIDKHPLNFQFVGLILLMFPNAKVIHTTRHPLDTCLSCFFQNFTKGQHYSFDLAKLAHFYNDYARLMEHWQTIFPGRILDVSYEDVIESQESETRRLLAHCNLEFEDACLDFHKTDRVVKTASFLQVRQPLYKTSQARWRNYQEQLRDVAAIIGIELDLPVTITSSNRILGAGT